MPLSGASRASRRSASNSAAGWSGAVMRSLGSVGAVAGIAEAGHDEGLIVQTFVDRRGPDRHIGMNAAHALDSLWRTDQANESDVLTAALLQTIDGGDRCVGRGQHRHHHNHQPLGDVVWRLEIIFNRNHRFRLTIEPDMRDM